LIPSRDGDLPIDAFGDGPIEAQDEQGTDPRCDIGSSKGDATVVVSSSETIQESAHERF
jgi:hypothetical protein